MKPHKHAEIIKAWADGAEIECLCIDGEWGRIYEPQWLEKVEYRVKPQPKPDVVRFFAAGTDNNELGCFYGANSQMSGHNLKLTFDGETNKLKSAEVISNE